MTKILMAAVLAVALATPAIAQQTTTPAPQAEKGQSQKAQKANKGKSADKAKAGERANKGGAARGEDRASDVKDMNKARKTN